MNRSYRHGPGIHHIDLEIVPGEVHALVGLNGAGKSTLMKVLLGMLQPRSGTVTVGGNPARSAGPEVWARAGHLVEGPLVYGEFTVTANLLMSAALHAVPTRERRRIVDDAIADFDLGPYARHRARTLSFGNLQRLGLAAALQHHPAFVVLDEPTTGLDPAGTILLRERLRNAAAAGSAVLISSHHLDEVSRVADRITVINRGRIVGQLEPGTAELEQTFFALVLDDDRQRIGREPDGLR